MVKKSEVIGAVAVIGGGIAGVQAALDLADMGFKVHIIEKSPSIGGVMAQLDKTFPTNDCSMCILSPKLVDAARHPNIELLTLAEVQGIEGAPGNFTVSVLQKPRYVDLEKCTSCGSCEAVCPVSLPNAFEYGLSKRKAIYRPFPQAIPNSYVIDKIGDGKRRCVECGRCDKECKSGAIDHSQQPKTLSLHVGAVILAAGSQPFDPVVKPEFGYRRYKNVLTSVEFERVLSASGPTQGKILRPSDQHHPKKIAWVHCVGSRDASVNHEFCSAMCCMYTAKEAVIAKEHASDIEPTVFFIDVRSYGKDFDKYINRARQEHGLRYVRSRISDIIEDPTNQDLTITYEDDCSELQKERFELVVLSVGLCGVKEHQNELLVKLGIDANEYGFVKTNPDTPVVVKPGVFAVGSLLEPQAIPESVMQASAAAANAAALLRDAKGTLVKERVYPAERDVSKEEPRVGVFICHCGINIGGYLDVPRLVKYVSGLPNVGFVDANLYTCSEDTQKKIVDAIKTHRLNRVVVAACTPRTHEPLFQKSLRDAQLNPYLLEMTNIREQCSWVHMDQPERATEKAEQLLRMNVAKARLLQSISEAKIPVTQRALILGGGVAGMTAALSLADQGYETVLVEKEARLGGFLHSIYHTVDGLDIPKVTKTLTEAVSKHPLVKVYTSAQLASLKGYVGNYESVIQVGTEKVSFQHGVVVVTVGASEYKPRSYHYGKDSRVLTQTELERKLAMSSPADVPTGQSYVMIQCVENRDETRPYCSRICCMHAVKNALRIKELNPKAEVYILYRDLMTYGFKERYYKEAREKGVVFLQYTTEKKPEVENKNGLAVKVWEPMLRQTIKIPADFLVLSTGLVPNTDNKDIGKLLKVPVNDDGFFLEAHVKLRPVDFSTRGVFLAGSCHTPKFISESIYQAQAAAARAATILAQPTLLAEPNTAVVTKELCSGCKICIPTCPYKAIESIEETVDGKTTITAKVNEGLCQGCGTCVSACPSGAMQQRGFKDSQILAMIQEIT